MMRQLLKLTGFLVLLLVAREGTVFGAPKLFPMGFLWGVSASSYQIEGGNLHSDWVEWEKQPDKIVDGSVAGAAANHVVKYEGDFALAKELGLSAFQTTLEWSRLEPTKGKFDKEAVAYYRHYLQTMRRHGLEPFIMLHYVSNPDWFQKMGGWANQASVREFEKFAAFAAQQFGDLVDYWITFGQPLVYATRAYLSGGQNKSGGDFPPGDESDIKALEAGANLLKAHARAYHTLRKEDKVDANGDKKAAMVTLLKNLTLFQPLEERSAYDKMATKIIDQLYNWAFLDALLDPAKKGKINLTTGKKSLSESYPLLADTLDFVAVSYLTRKFVNAKNGINDPKIINNPASGARMTDRDVEIYPRGLNIMAEETFNKYKRPLFIMFNGIDDRTGKKRSAFILDHVTEIWNTIQNGVPILGYFHWTFLDCFEWSQGYRSKYGLFKVDYQDPSLARTWTPGARTYQTIIQNNGLQ